VLSSTRAGRRRLLAQRPAAERPRSLKTLKNYLRTRRTQCLAVESSVASTAGLGSVPSRSRSKMRLRCNFHRAETSKDCYPQALPGIANTTKRPLIEAFRKSMHVTQGYRTSRARPRKRLRDFSAGEHRRERHAAPLRANKHGRLWRFTDVFMAVNLPQKPQSTTCHPGSIADETVPETASRFSGRRVSICRARSSKT
jgi:hypothetical protein